MPGVVAALPAAGAPALDAAGALDPAAGTKRPVRFQKAENPLNGPPTTWLDHWSV